MNLALPRVCVDISNRLLSCRVPPLPRRMDSPQTRQTLLLKIRDSDDDVAWGEFVDLYTPLIYRFCVSRGVAQQDLADVTQDTMRAVAGAIGRFEYDAARGRFRSWLFRVAYSKLVTHFRKKQRQPQGTGSTTIHQRLDEIPRVCLKTG